MPLTAIGAGLALADDLLKAFTPTITDEQKESLLNAYKKRIADIQAAGDAIVASPDNRPAQLGLAALTRELLNNAGYPAPGMAGLFVNVPLDDYLQTLAALDLLNLVNEQAAQAVKS